MLGAPNPKSTVSSSDTQAVSTTAVASAASAASTALAAETLGTTDLRFAQLRPLTRQEEDAAGNCVASTRHSKLTVLQNHSMNLEGELEGFCFECNSADSASVLPMTRSSFSTTSIYECLTTAGQPAPYLKLVSDLQASSAKLQDIVTDLRSSEVPPLKFDCMPDWENLQQSQHHMRDQREWSETVPAKFGLYHCFMRTNAQNMREHKVFIVISGHCAHACEEMYNLWLDARHVITAQQFMECAEVGWLRQTTARHHNRIAARVAHKFGLTVRFLTDTAAVGASVDMILPTISCVYRDMHMLHTTVSVSNDAALLSMSKSGIIFDCWSTEGLWVFMGPRDTSSYKIFGTEFGCAHSAKAFPCKTVRYHAQYAVRDKQSLVPVHVPKAAMPTSKHTANTVATQSAAQTQVCIYEHMCRKFSGYMFPYNAFVHDLERLGFCQNDGITNLMPIVMYCADE
jgi:hypothetical protein